MMRKAGVPRGCPSLVRQRPYADTDRGMTTNHNGTRRFQGLATVLLLLLPLGCAATTPEPVAAPPVPEAPARAPEPVQPRPAPSPVPPLDVSVPPPPPECSAYAAHPSGICPGTFVEELDEALSSEDPLERDSKLALLESCKAVPRGWVRGLRADAAPPSCGDALVEAFFATAPAGVTVPMESALVGLALAARLRRLDGAPPPAPTPNSKATFEEYFRTELTPWVNTRAAAIFALSTHGAHLEGYGRGVVAVEAAVADLRFVQLAREVPLSDEMNADAAVRDEYYAALDMALEPRKTRGRDAALAGLAEFHRLGAIVSPRIARAREVLSQSYAGHRIDALDGLRLPELPSADGTTPEARLAQRLPTFFAEHVFAEADPTTPALLRPLLERGLYPSARARLERSPLPLESAELYARGLLLLGQRYWTSESFRRASEAAAIVPPAGKPVSDSSRLVMALGSALANGPKDARAMMLGGPLLPRGVGDVRLLDELAKGQGELAAMAAYDAAYLLAFLPPTEQVKEFWTGIATRYDRAARLTKDPEFKKDAQERAKAARETARAVR